jgi:hypothetical protein
VAKSNGGFESFICRVIEVILTFTFACQRVGLGYYHISFLACHTRMNGVKVREVQLLMGETINVDAMQ